MKTKLLIAALMLSMSLSLFAQSGTCGANLTWNLSNGVLTITGTGDMTDYNYVYNYSPSTTAPWASNRTIIKSVVISDGVTSIGSAAFSGCSSLTSVTIPNSVTRIGEEAFYWCSVLTSVTIPNSVTSIGDRAFCDCSGLMSVTIPNNVTSIGYRTFYGCSGLTSVTIPNSVTSIGLGAFYGCSGLTAITIPSSVTSIEYQAFYKCSSLISITIPNSVTSIKKSAFSGCSGIKTITSYAETPPTAQSTQLDNSQLVTYTAFDDLDVSDITLYVPEQWVPLYKYDHVWRQFNIKGIDASEGQFTVTWKNYDGSVLETDENVASGTIPAYNGATPVKPADDHYIYTFAGWSPTVVTVTGDATYVATYTATVKEHTYIIHVNQDCTSYMEEQQ